MYLHALLLWTTDFDFFCFIFRVQSQTSQSHPHVQNPASAHHQVSWSIIHRIHCAFMKIVEVHVFLWFTILFLYMAAQEKYFFSIVFTYGLHPPDIKKVDNAHHQWINLYPLDSAVGFLNTYTVSVRYWCWNRGQCYPKDKSLSSGQHIDFPYT